MKRLFYLLAVIFAFSASGLAQTKTDTIRLEFNSEESTELTYSFSEKILPYIEIELLVDGNSSRFKPVESELRHTFDEPCSGWTYIYYTHEPQDAYDFALKSSYYTGNDDIEVFFKYSTSLDVSGCTALTELYCSCSRLTDLNASGCTALTELYCSCSRLTDLNASGCTALTSLDCYNELTSLDVSGCTALTSLDCYNELTSLDVSGCTTLTSLNLSRKQLKSLDVSGCTALTSLDCYDNELTSLDVSGCTALTSLDCYDNELTSLDVSGCTKLKTLKGARTGTGIYDYIEHYLTVDTLKIYGASMDTLVIGEYSEIKAIDAAGCTSIENLSCSYIIGLTDLNVSGCPSLKSLKCGGASYRKGSLRELNVSGCTALTSLDCSYNALTSLDVSGCTALTSLDCYDNELTSLDVSKNTSLTSLDCGGNAWTEWTAVSESLETLYCSRTKNLTKLDVSGCPKLRKLDCGGNAWTEWTAVSESLETLYCSRTKNLTKLDVSGCPKLRRLDCAENEALTEWTVVSESLDSLDCSGNQYLVKLDVSGCTALTNLDCRSNQLTSLDVSKNTALTNLDCRSNQLTSLDVSKNTALTNLDCRSNQLTSLDVSKNTALTNLDCRSNQLTSLDVSGCTALTRLYCGDNRLPLSVLYEAYSQCSYWYDFRSESQSNSIMLLIDQPLDLSSERIIGQVISTYELTDVNGKEVDAGFWEENRFEFKFHEPLKYTLKLQNPNVKEDGRYGDPVTFTWHISVVEEMPSYTVMVSSNNTEWGTTNITGNGTYEYGTEATVTATPKEGYRFVNWTKKDGTVFSTEATHTFKVTENLELTANFEEGSGNVSNGSLETDNFRIYAKDRVIYLSEDRVEVRVYTVLGQCIYNGRATAIPVRQSGLYIVKVGNSTYKVMVR